MLVVAALVIGWLGIRWLEQALVYHPDRNLSMIPNSFGLPFEELRLTAEDGASIHGWFLPAPSSKPGYAILFCHGNAGNISHRLTKSRLLRPLGLAILLFDYRGYGRSEGTPSEEGTYWDAEAAYRYLVDKKGYSPDRIVLYGESLGAAVALELALRRASRALILESPFTSVPDMGQRIFPYLPLRWLLRYRYDNLAKIPGLREPIFILHSPQDDVVPYEMGRRLFEAAPEPKRFFQLSGDHNEGFLDTGDAYPKAFADFLSSLARRPRAS